MKKIISLILISVLSCLISSVPSFAASQTVILKPTDSDLGVSKVYAYNSSTISVVASNGGTDLSNALAEDEQFALLDPSLPGPSDTLATNTLLMLDYEKNTICSQADIQQVAVHVIWKSDGDNTQATSAAVLFLTEDYDGSPSIGVQLNSTSTEASIISTVFGGLANPSNLAGGTFSGLVGTSLTHDSSAVQTLPSLANLNDPSARIGVSMGQTEPETVTGMLDYAYLEVTYDDANCSPEGIDPATIAPPKTGAALTAGIIVAGLLALAGASFFGVKRTKLKHRVSERE